MSTMSLARWFGSRGRLGLGINPSIARPLRHPEFSVAQTETLPNPNGDEPCARLTYNAPMIPCAYLRVFRPLDSFPPEERAQWQGYIESGGPPPARPPPPPDAAPREGGPAGPLRAPRGGAAARRPRAGVR